jgi:hypothetical protein
MRKAGEQLFVILAPVPGTPDETFVELETKDGRGVGSVPSVQGGGLRRIGPLYEKPIPSQRVLSESQNVARALLWDWNELTGALSPRSSWYYEVESILNSAVLLASGVIPVEPNGDGPSERLATAMERYRAALAAEGIDAVEPA